MSKTKNIGLNLTTDENIKFGPWRKSIDGPFTTNANDMSNMQIIDEAFGAVTERLKKVEGSNTVIVQSNVPWASIEGPSDDYFPIFDLDKGIGDLQEGYYKLIAYSAPTNNNNKTFIIYSGDSFDTSKNPFAYKHEIIFRIFSLLDAVCANIINHFGIIDENGVQMHRYEYENIDDFQNTRSLYAYCYSPLQVIFQLEYMGNWQFTTTQRMQYKNF